MRELMWRLISWCHGWPMPSEIKHLNLAERRRMLDVFGLPPKAGEFKNGINVRRDHPDMPVIAALIEKGFLFRASTWDESVAPTMYIATQEAHDVFNRHFWRDCAAPGVHAMKHENRETRFGDGTRVI